VKIQTLEMPAHIAELAQDYGIFAIYLETAEKCGSHDLVVAIDPADPDNAYAGPRSELLEGFREDADNPLSAPMAERLKLPASFITGAQQSYWLLVKGDEGFHCVAVGGMDRSKTSVRT
jgi:hypothetical protein